MRYLFQKAKKERIEDGTYPLSAKEAKRLKLSQGNVCAICGSLEFLVIDHDHKTGNVREALCFHCNTGLGMFRDNVNLLRKAANYLSRHNSL